MAWREDNLQCGTQQMLTSPPCPSRIFISNYITGAQQIDIKMHRLWSSDTFWTYVTSPCVHQSPMAAALVASVAASQLSGPGPFKGCPSPQLGSHHKNLPSVSISLTGQHVCNCHCHLLHVSSLLWLYVITQCIFVHVHLLKVIVYIMFNTLTCQHVSNCHCCLLHASLLLSICCRSLHIFTLPLV